MKSKLDKTWVGVVLGLVSIIPVLIGEYFFFQEWFYKYDLEVVIRNLKLFGFMQKLITLLFVPNAILFFVLLRIDYGWAARGIMLVVFAMLLLFLI